MRKGQLLLLFGLVASAALGLSAGSTPGPESAVTAFPGANGRIAFTSTRDGRDEVYVMNADGTEQTNLTNHDVEDGRPARSTHGRKRSFVFLMPEIHTMNIDGTGMRHLSRNRWGEDSGSDWSPDESRIV